MSISLATTGSPKGHKRVVVVGSGYGGAVTAARLAEKERSVCILERGEELRPGDYPESLGALWHHTRLHLPCDWTIHPKGMFDFRRSPDITVLTGSGLGGTSLINAGVALPRRTTDKRWPQSLQEPSSLHRFYKIVKRELGISTYPDIALPRKYELLERCAGSVGGTLKKAPVAVHFGPGDASDRAPCNFCGNCVTGCNRGSKNTLIENYLPLAHRHGAEIYTGVEVRWIEHSPRGGWIVWHRRNGTRGRPAPLTADVVILAGGTLGSTEILLRSRERGLRLSPMLGHHFTGNGDILDVAYDTDHLANAVGTDDRRTRAGSLVGPCITGYVEVDAPDGSPLFLLEEGVIPGGLARLLPLAMAATAYRTLRDTVPFAVKLERRSQWAANGLQNPGGRAVSHSMVFLLMAVDDGNGQILLSRDRLNVSWPDRADRPVEAHRGRLAAATARAGGTFLHKALSTGDGRRPPITVHPLGGCVMADDIKGGVVDQYGQVFSGSGERDVHAGLYVVDGSTVPAPLGVNPLLTIAALAERTAQHMIDTEVGA